jgi:hypothetical protein
VSHPPAAPVQYAHPGPPAAPPPPKKKKRGCCSCCLWIILIFVILSVSFVVAAQFMMRTPANPVKEEYESIPDYFSLLDPECRRIEDESRELGTRLPNPQSAIRNPQSELDHEPHEPHKRINPQSAIRNPQWFGGAHV